MLELDDQAEATLSRSQTIADFTTRTHYPGRHPAELLVNDLTVAQGHFDLKKPATRA